MVKIVFFGTSEICLPFLHELEKTYAIELAVTQPDALGGRNRKTVIVPPVKMFALERGIEVMQPEKLTAPEFREKLAALAPVIGVVIAYGRLIPARIFSIPAFRMINVHFSLLPQYRGAAPVQRAIMNGDAQTGVTIFELVSQMDAGPIWAQQTWPVQPDDTTASLWDKLSRGGAEFLIRTLNGILTHQLEKKTQDESRISYAPPLSKEEGVADWSQTAQQIYNRLRAFNPWPGLCSNISGQIMKLTDVRVSGDQHQRSPGTVLSIDRETLKIACGANTVLEILEIQPPGKKPMSPFCYCLGHKLPEKWR